MWLTDDVSVEVDEVGPGTSRAPRTWPACRPVVAGPATADGLPIGASLVGGDGRGADHRANRDAVGVRLGLRARRPPPPAAAATDDATRRRPPEELLGGGADRRCRRCSFGAVVLFGTLLTRDGFPVTVFLAIRFLVAAVFLAAVLLGLRRPLMAAPGEGVPLLLLGVFGYAVESGLFFGAVQHGSAPAATLLFFTYPVWVSLIWVAVRRRLPERLVLVSLGVAVDGSRDRRRGLRRTGHLDRRDPVRVRVVPDVLAVPDRARTASSGGPTR